MSSRSLKMIEMAQNILMHNKQIESAPTIETRTLVNETMDSPEETFDDSDIDPDYIPEEICSSLIFNSNSHETLVVQTPPRKKARKSQAAKTMHYQNKYPLLLAKCICKNKCNEKSTQSAREQTYNAFINMNFSERRLFLDKCISQNKVKIRSQKQDAKVRNYTLTYTLINSSDEQKCTKVCKNMFLSTLGWKHDGFVMEHFKSKTKETSVTAITTDKRGEIRRNAMVELKATVDCKIKLHIESFNPIVSHYILVNSPNRRYLTPDLSVRYLWKDYVEQNSESNVSYETYRKVFKLQNIGFSAPSEDDCVSCSLYKSHSNNSEACCSSSSTTNHDEFNCEICIKFKSHHINYTAAQKAYEVDKTKKWEPNTNIYTVDMQKVMIIPKMTLKNSYFISRLVVFNETFACLHDSKDICVLWNESISGRRASDVASTYYTIIKRSSSDVNQFIFWADNCSGQNKNWLLFTMFVHVVNQVWGRKSILMKYFESGHSFMRADSVHGLIGSEWKRRSEVLTMDDMEDVVLKSSSNISIVKMNHMHFYQFSSGIRARRQKDEGDNVIPNIAEVKIVEFRKGCREMFFKISHEEINFRKTNFLKKNTTLTKTTID